MDAATTPAPPTFRMIPTRDELAGITRDVRHFPVRNEAPGVLTREQIRSFDRDGFVFPLTIFDADEMAGIRAHFDALLARTLAAGGDSYSISSAHLKSGRCWDLMVHPRIVACVRDLLGDDVVAWGCHFFCKLPRDGRTVAWHQDCSYWPLTPTKTVTAWLAIDDADRGNACMKFLPGSHREGQLPFRDSDQGEGNVLDQTVEDVARWGAPVFDELRAGQMSLHSDLLLHGSDANESDRRRCGLTLRYCAAEVRAHLGWNAKGIVVAGSDPSGHWANPPRPAAD